MSAETIRAFIAIDLSDPIRAELEAVQQALAAANHRALKLSIPKAGNIHLTLKFLGDIAPELVPQIHERIAPRLAQCRPFSLQVRGCGAFPHLNRPKVLWAGVALDDALRAVQAAVIAGLDELGLDAEHQAFRPHLTLARVKRSRPDVLNALVKPYLRHYFGDFKIERVTLYRSTLNPAGAIYEPLSMWTLGE